MTSPAGPAAAGPAERSDRELFEATRPALVGLAYRLLGSRADAEDAVQDAFLQWLRADRPAIENPAGWLTTTCTRRCLDLMRAAHRRRVDYVGPWLPEPLPTALHTAAGDAPDEQLALASSLTTAFLLMLERLAPKERAAFLLREVFDRPYDELARTLGVREAACRKLVSRARATLARAPRPAGRDRPAAPAARQRELLTAFETAIAGGGVDALAGLLADDVALCVDGGGRVPALGEVLRGRDAVLAFVAGPLREYWAPYERRAAELNGEQGVVLRQDGHITAAVSFAYNECGALTDVYIMRNPDKLVQLGRSTAPTLELI